MARKRKVKRETIPTPRIKDIPNSEAERQQAQEQCRLTDPKRYSPTREG